jgi:hypothetical protein
MTISTELGTGFRLYKQLKVDKQDLADARQVVRNGPRDWEHNIYSGLDSTLGALSSSRNGALYIFV